MDHRLNLAQILLIAYGFSLGLNLKREEVNRE
jgi:hypothetical protein